MKTTRTILFAAAALWWLDVKTTLNPPAVEAGFNCAVKCNVCNGTGWQGRFKCVPCKGDGVFGN